MMLRRKSLVATLLAFALAIAACSPSDSADTTTTLSDDSPLATTTTVMVEETTTTEGQSAAAACAADVELTTAGVLTVDDQGHGVGAGQGQGGQHTLDNIGGATHNLVCFFPQHHIAQFAGNLPHKNPFAAITVAATAKNTDQPAVQM